MSTWPNSQSTNH